jgi:carbamate kinase
MPQRRLWLWADGGSAPIRDPDGMRILAALGGNALLRRGEPAEAAAQRRDVELAARSLAALAADHELVLTHAGGPELELALRNELPGRNLITVLTEVVVSSEDPAFRAPSKPIGPVYPAGEAQRLAAERGWSLGADGDGFRRLVPSPEPGAIAELRSLRTLIDAGALVICAGGGIPIALDGAGAMRGVEAVIDKDLTAALLARRLDADLLVMLTDVNAVHLGWGSDDDRPLRTVSAAELREFEFAAGSMGPKVEAACRFVEATGRRAAIGSLKDAVEIVAGGAGTQVCARRGAPASASARPLPRR